MNVYVCLEFITTVSSHSPEYIEYHPIFNPFSQAFSFWGWSKSIFKLFDVFPCMSTPEPPLIRHVFQWVSLPRWGSIPGCQSLLFWDSLGGHPLSNDHRIKWYALNHLFFGVRKLPPVGSQNLQTCDQFNLVLRDLSTRRPQRIYIYTSQISGIVILNVKHEIVIRHQAIVVLVTILLKFRADTPNHEMFKALPFRF